MASNMATSLSSVLPGTLVSLLQKFCTSSLQVYQNNAPVGLAHYIFIDTIRPKYHPQNIIWQMICKGELLNFYILTQSYWYKFFDMAMQQHLSVLVTEKQNINLFLTFAGFFYQSMYKFHIIILIPTSSDVV